MRVRTHANPFKHRQRLDPIDWSAVFDDPSKGFDLEIGFGRGLFLHRYATTYPHRNIIGVEVRKPAVEGVRKKVASLPNVFVCHSTAQIVLEDVIPQKSLHRVFVFHPDPWFKKSHHKRRVFNDALIETLLPKLHPQARLYVSTDVQDLWEAMTGLLSRYEVFTPIEEGVFWSEDYHTNWQAFSKQDRRNCFAKTYQYDDVCLKNQAEI